MWDDVNCIELGERQAGRALWRTLKHRQLGSLELFQRHLLDLLFVHSLAAFISTICDYILALICSYMLLILFENLAIRPS